MVTKALHFGLQKIVSMLLGAIYWAVESFGERKVFILPVS